MSLWVFGYGSLIFRPGFPYVSSEKAKIFGFARRFWQLSMDHRGTSDLPGRVVTLVEEAGSVCEGVVFEVAASAQESVLSYLDHREKGGYDRRFLKAEFESGLQTEVLCYVGSLENPCISVEKDIGIILDDIVRAEGPSGCNISYLLELHRELSSLSIGDPHIEALVMAYKNLRATMRE